VTFKGYFSDWTETKTKDMLYCVFVCVLCTCTQCAVITTVLHYCLVM